MVKELWADQGWSVVWSDEDHEILDGIGDHFPVAVNRDTGGIYDLEHDPNPELPLCFREIEWGDFSEGDEELLVGGIVSGSVRVRGAIHGVAGASPLGCLLC